MDLVWPSFNLIFHNQMTTFSYFYLLMSAIISSEIQQSNSIIA